MGLWKNGYRLPSIKTKDPGQAEWTAGMFFLLMLGILMYTQLQIASWRSTSLYLEDALAASNLAAALIDVEEYGKTHKVRIADLEEAYRIYCDAVRENLCLDSQWTCENKGLIAGTVEIADFIIYNVDRETVTANRLNAEGRLTQTWRGRKGEMTAPDGNIVENTGIYSEISFPVEGFWGITITAHKGKLVDIVSLKGEENENREKE